MSYEPSHRKPPPQERWPSATPAQGWPPYRDGGAYRGYEADGGYGANRRGAYEATWQQAGNQRAAGGSGDRGYQSSVAMDTFPPDGRGYDHGGGGGYADAADGYRGYGYQTGVHSGGGYPGGGRAVSTNGYAGAANEFAGGANGYGGAGHGYSGTVDGYGGTGHDYGNTVNGYDGTGHGYSGTVDGYGEAGHGYSDTVDGHGGTVDGYGEAGSGYGGTVDGYTNAANGYAGIMNGYTRNADGYVGTGNGYAGTLDGYAGAAGEFDGVMDNFDGMENGYSRAEGGYGRTTAEHVSAADGYDGYGYGYGGSVDSYSGSVDSYGNSTDGYWGGADGYARGADGYVQGADGYGRGDEDRWGQADDYGVHLGPGSYVEYAQPGSADPMLKAPDVGIHPDSWQADQDSRREAAERGMLVGAVTEVLGIAVVIGVTTLAAALFRAQVSPVAAMGSVFIDRIPAGLRNAVMQHFGASGRHVLLLGMFAAIAFIALVVGALARRAAAFAVIGVAAFTAGVAFIAVTRPAGHVSAVMPAVVGGIAGAAALLWLVHASAPVAPLPYSHGRARRRAR